MMIMKTKGKNKDYVTLLSFIIEILYPLPLGTFVPEELSITFPAFTYHHPILSCQYSKKPKQLDSAQPTADKGMKTMLSTQISVVICK